MTGLNKERLSWTNLKPIIVVFAVLGVSLAMGFVASGYVLVGLLALMGLALMLLQPGLGLAALVATALVADVKIPTGTAVVLNPATLMVPALAGILLAAVLSRRQVTLAKSRVMLPMLALLMAALVSLFVGNATWDPFVPKSGNFLLVQLAQWALLLFSFVAFWLAASLGRDVRWLKWMTVAFLVIGGALAALYLIPQTFSLARALSTVALIRAPFWLLLFALAGGQLLFNSRLTQLQRVFLGAVVVVALVYVFIIGRQAASNWIGVGAALAILAWLRFPRFRWVALAVIVLLMLSGLVFPTVWNFAGGDDEWTGSGQSRLVLIERVVTVSLRNPVTGLGPVAYRNYAGTTPLAYGRAYWLQPQINSHNNYVDIFAQYGLVGLALFGWMAVEIGRLGTGLLGKYRDGFEAGYVRAMLAAGVGALALMVFADWILPFVYNIGFPGFQASVLFWLFLGGLVALEDIATGSAQTEGKTAGE